MIRVHGVNMMAIVALD